jgi:hypothetical protein
VPHTHFKPSKLSGKPENSKPQFCRNALKNASTFPNKGKLPEGGYRTALASATVRAVIFTMRRTVALGVKMWTGLAAPRRTGPMAILPPAAVFKRL